MALMTTHSRLFDVPVEGPLANLKHSTMRLPPPIKYINPRYSLYVGGPSVGDAPADGYFADDSGAGMAAAGAVHGHMPTYGVHDAMYGRMGDVRVRTLRRWNNRV